MRLFEASERGPDSVLHGALYGVVYGSSQMLDEHEDGSVSCALEGRVERPGPAVVVSSLLDAYDWSYCALGARPKAEQPLGCA